MLKPNYHRSNSNVDYVIWSKFSFFMILMNMHGYPRENEYRISAKFQRYFGETSLKSHINHTERIGTNNDENSVKSYKNISETSLYFLSISLEFRQNFTKRFGTNNDEISLKV